MNNEQTHDLRERVIRELDTVPVSCDDNGDNWYLENYVVDTMLKFAAEVAEEKNKRIAELEQDVIGFAEFLYDAKDDEGNPFEYVGKGKFMQRCGNSTSWTIQQLYEIYKK